MKSAAAAATKQLRWQLLQMFPKVPMKLITEAAKCGDFDAAVESIREAIGEVHSIITSEVQLPAVTEATLPEAVVRVDETKVPNIKEPKLCVDPITAPTETPPSTIQAKPHDFVCEEVHVNASDILREDRIDCKAEDILNNDSKNRVSNSTSTVTRSQDGWEIKCDVDVFRPCQSMRTKINGFAKTVLQHVGTDNTAAFAAVCFEQMLQREQELENDFCVFYHSYNAAALIYEVESEIARYAFGKDDKFPPLPRIIQKHFNGVTIDDLRNSEGAKHQDCLPEFRQLAICASVTLFAFESEAPPLNCFRHGYGISAPLGQLTMDLLVEATGLSRESSKSTLKALLNLASQYGLVAYGYGSGGYSSQPNRLGGQMLQIFIHRDEVDDMVYHSLPYGVPIDTPSVKRWLTGEDLTPAVDGQVRILMRPEVFLDESRGRIFHYCADWEFLGGSPDMQGSRAAFVQEIRKILEPVLSQIPADELRKRLTGESDTQRAARNWREKASAAARAKAKSRPVPKTDVAREEGNSTMDGSKRKGKR